MKADDILGRGLDVVYIKPLLAGGSCMPENGIALRSDLSMSFIIGEFSLTDHYEVLVHPDSTNEKLRSYAFRQINVPHNSFFRPSKETRSYNMSRIHMLSLEPGTIVRHKQTTLTSG